MAIGKMLFGGIDAGGTTFKCGVSDADFNLVRTHRVPVTSPEATLQECAEFFAEAAPEANLKSFGIASFGPLDIDPTSKTYGTILDTPKVGWAGTNLKEFFESKTSASVSVDTDVNGALLAEMSKGAAIDAISAAYITVGTGIGAGIFFNDDYSGAPYHPEFGHIPIRRHENDLAFESLCPFHSDCLEGLASARAVTARWGEPSEMPESHFGWEIIADYLAQACRVLTFTLRLERIVLGGGLLLAPHLLKLVQSSYDDQMAGYLGRSGKLGADLISTPGLGDDAGLIGAIMLGGRANC